MIFSVYSCREFCDNMYNKSPDERNDVRRCNMGDMGSLYGVNDAIKWLLGFGEKVRVGWEVFNIRNVLVAQWIRHPPTKREIAGSSPVEDFLFCPSNLYLCPHSTPPLSF